MKHFPEPNPNGKSTAMPAIKLSLRGVQKNFGNFTALHPSELDVVEGEFVTLLGPSGSGKSTLLKIIAGMEQPTAGRIEIGGRDATGIPARHRDLGMVFQNYALMPHMTVFENVAFPLRVRGLGKAEIERKVIEALNTVQLAHLKDRKPKALSGGQQQRVSIARAIVYSPSLVLMDEPLGALDKKLREQLQMEIKALHEKLGITVIYVTHDQQEAMSMSDRVVLMNDGRIEQMGSPTALYFEPQTEFTADFLGNSNFMEATVEAIDDARLSCRLDDGSPVTATSRGQAVPGERVRLMVRPEHLTVLDDTTAENVVTARSLGTTFLGDSILLQTEVDSIGQIDVIIPNSQNTSGLARGAVLRLGWGAKMTHVFQAEAQ